jgi:predicted ATPase/serine/threonine protein kinase
MPYDRGSRIGPYEIIGLLGAGGMGEVYRGRDPRLGRDVAVKVLTGDFAADSDRLRRFEAEARAAAALSHPNILAVYDVGSEGGVPYLVSEFLEGQTLRTALDIGPIPFRRVLDIARQISSGLTAAHTRGITHRDIKPDNIFITLDGRVKILDFGVAKRTSPLEPADGHAPTVADNTLTAAGMVVGTVGYMSPEQATGRDVDYRCDQFAFGILIYEMLSGRRAFARDTHIEELAAIIRDDPPPLAEIRPEAPLPLQWLLNRCLAKNPAERYESTRDLHRDLETLATHILQSQSPMPAKVQEATTLPMATTPLIGRDTDVVKAKQIVLRDSARLVTFTGPGGIGKTRLAMQVAHELKEQFNGGVHFANLATIADPNLVPQVVAQACGFRSSAQSPPLEAIAEHVMQSGKPTLLLLDSFEHLLGAVPFVVDLLKIAAPLKIVVTSREPLRLSSEHEVPVAPLSRPDAERTTSLESLAVNPAVMLFVERAQAAKPAFTLTSENARAIGEICNRLDGLPLAIELAAARVKTLPPSALLGRMETRLQILTGGARDLPARQQTLRGAIAWSHDLLGEAEQRLFRRISVFIGGCTFEAAEAVADTKRDLGVDIIDGIESLVHKSLLQLIESHDDEARLAMMETVREYGFERLVESGEEKAARKAHAAYYLVLAEEAANAIEGADQPIWIDRLDRDRGNLRAALDWLTRTGNAEWGLRLASALLRYWELRELFVEGRRRLSALLALPGAAASTPLRAKGLFAAGALAAGQRDYRHQMPLFQESLQIYREQGDRQGMGIAMNAIAIALKDQGDVAEARRIFEEISLIWMDLGDNLLHARALSNLASILKEQGDIVAALARYDEALGIFRQLGDDQGVAWTLRHQGDIARDQCDFELGESLYLQSLAVFRNLADEWSAGSLLTDLGGLALSHGEVSRGIDFFRQATDAFQQHGGHRRGLARVLEGFALAASLDGDAQRAIRLAGAAAALRNALGTPLTPAEQRQVTSGLEIAHAQLSPAARSQAWGEGWTMTLDQAIEFGLNAGV